MSDDDLATFAGDGDRSFVTVAEAAERLSVTLPRLRRLLNRPDFARHVTQRERRTRTGTRTAKAVPVTVLVALREALERPEGEEAEAEPERERERERQNEAIPVTVLVDELRARIADLSAALEHERDAHRRAEVLHLNTQGELSELRRRAAELEAANSRLIALLPAKVNEGEDGNESAPPDAPVAFPAAQTAPTHETWVPDVPGVQSGEGGREGDSSGEIAQVGTVSRGRLDDSPSDTPPGASNIGHTKSGWWGRFWKWAREN